MFEEETEEQIQQPEATQQATETQTEINTTANPDSENKEKSFDYKNATPEELKNEFSKFAPDSIDEYKILDALKDENGNATYEVSDDVVQYFGNHFKDLGIPSEVGNNLFKLYAQYEQEQFNKLTDINDLNSRLKNIFGDDEQTKKTCENLIKQSLPKEDLLKINDFMPNHFLEIMYRMAKNVSDKYGYKEPTPHNAGRTPTSEYLTPDEKNEKYKETFNKLQDLKRRQHTHEEKAELLKELERYV